MAFFRCCRLYICVDVLHMDLMPMPKLLDFEPWALAAGSSIKQATVVA